MRVPAKEFPHLFRSQRCAGLLLLLLMLLLLHESCSHRKEIVRRPLQAISARLQLLRPQPCQNGAFEGRHAAGDASGKFPNFEEKRGTDAGGAARKYTAVMVEQRANVARPLYRLLQSCSRITRTTVFEIATNARTDKPANNNQKDEAS